ncbi:hypothetical protein NLX83_01570 [Allokutzneria sp. A3M-2-11 16]|uniref:hypothetical protein n=1 Tax=Allokutzneria sp. A3M-2-11 16 TaxID=2962043 RepID=UPI0020B8D184|nr:hypothetical protein [Allokutzneria sp. A3M-2-11 16]MCP3797938.1 hypothetical protein [Allokutzneria sp. A3M-2-11 16]
MSRQDRLLINGTPEKSQHGASIRAGLRHDCLNWPVRQAGLEPLGVPGREPREPFPPAYPGCSPGEPLSGGAFLGLAPVQGEEGDFG